MPDLIDHDYEAVGAFYNQQISISNNYNEITISDLSSAITNSNIQYNHPGYNLFTDNKRVITNDMDHNDKAIMLLHRDYYRRKLYVKLQKQELMAGVESTACEIAQMIKVCVGQTLSIEDKHGIIEDKQEFERRVEVNAARISL